MRTREPELWKGIVAGAAGGLAASWIMTQFQTGWSKIKEKRKKPDAESQADQGQSEDATMRTAGAIARSVFRKDLTIEQKKRLGPLVHYAFGTVMGALYGGMREEFQATSTGWGTVFGSAIFLGADEVAIPLLGLGPGPTASPLNTHLYAWASHAVYGAALESVRMPVRSALGYDDLGSKVRRAQEKVEESYETSRDVVGRAKKEARKGWKTGMKAVEKTARRMRQAA